MALAIGVISGLWMATGANAGHTYSPRYNPTTCGNCHNASHTGNQDAKKIFEGYPWLYRNTGEYDASAAWQNYASDTLLSTPRLDELSEFCLKCHGNPSWKTNPHLGDYYIDPRGTHHHPIGVEITDALINQRANRMPPVLQDQMSTLPEMQNIFYLGGPDKNILNCATCHGYIHKAGDGPYDHRLTLPFEDNGAGQGGAICGACHKGKWQDLHE